MNNYINFKKYAVRYDTNKKCLEFYNLDKGIFISEIKLYYQDGGILSTEHEITTTLAYFDRRNELLVHLNFTDKEPLVFTFSVDSEGIKYKAPDNAGSLFFCGIINFGDNPGDLFPMIENTTAEKYSGADFMSAYGNITSSVCDILFDRKTDSAVCVGVSGRAGEGFTFDRQNSKYNLRFSAGENLNVSIRSHVFETKWNLPYKCINKENNFPTPPCGFMTWYSLKFDTYENRVFENIKTQSEKLKKYGANAIWIDWEWYHDSFEGNGKPGIDVFNPSQERYPHGLGYVADYIKSEGFTPCLWIGATNDPIINGFVGGTPDALLTERISWCGRYYIDPTHPKVLDEFIPRVFGQILGWGYQAVKWDCLPISARLYDEFHDKLYDKSKTSEEAIRGLFDAARTVFGKNRYMLSCSGEFPREIEMCADYFDAARIGGDIFNFDEFRTTGVARALEFYPLHNIMLYNDMDNVVLRPEFNNSDEAKTRASFISLLGLPVTYGDDLTVLPEDRIDILRKITPALDIRPVLTEKSGLAGEIVKINLAINTPFEDYNIFGAFNFTDENKMIDISLKKNLLLCQGKYLIYDFWDRRFLGTAEENITFNVNPHGTVVLAVRKLTGVPQLLSTSRHISQGAQEIRTFEWNDDEKAILISGEIVEGDEYSISIYIPQGYEYISGNEFEHEISDNELILKFKKEVTGIYSHKINFMKE